VEHAANGNNAAMMKEERRMTGSLS
jgi:hypothetical protein